MFEGIGIARRFLCLFCLFAPLQSTPLLAAETAETSLERALEAVRSGDIHEALKAAHQATLMLTQADRFHIRTAKLVSTSPGGFGIYEERPEGPLVSGEPIYVYMEPGAFKFGGPDGRFDYGFTVDFRIATSGGKILGGQDQFGKFEFSSFRPNTEVFINLTLNLTGVPDGDYILKIVVHDLISNETAVSDLPVSFASQ